MPLNMFCLMVLMIIYCVSGLQLFSGILPIFCFCMGTFMSHFLVYWELTKNIKKVVNRYISSPEIYPGILELLKTILLEKFESTSFVREWI